MQTCCLTTWGHGACERSGAEEEGCIPQAWELDRFSGEVKPRLQYLQVGVVRQWEEGVGERSRQREGLGEKAWCSQGSETSVISKVEMVRDLVDAREVDPESRGEMVEEF